jgi:hypothetical protein
MNATSTVIVYDAAAVSRILGIPCECSDPVPEAADGLIVIYYGGWDLKTLRDCVAGKKFMWQNQQWYDDKEWNAESGYYQVNLRVTDSNRKSCDEQVAHLRTIDEAFQPAPVTVAVTALLVHLMETGNDLLQKDWCRCSEPLPSDSRANLTVDHRRVRVDRYWGGFRYDNLWLAASRKS